MGATGAGAAGTAAGYGAESVAGAGAAGYGAEGVGGLGGATSALGAGAAGAGSSIWDSIGSAIGAAVPAIAGLAGAATNAYGSSELQNLLEDIKKGSDPFAGERSKYFGPTQESSELLSQSQDLAYRGLNDPTYWDQSWLNDAAERAGADTQKRLASQGYNFSTNTINNMSKNMRDTRAGYIIPGQQNLISNVNAQSGATNTLGNLAGAQFNIGQAAPSLINAQNAINSGYGQAAGNITAGIAQATPGLQAMFGPPIPVSTNNVPNTYNTQPNYLGPATDWGTEGYGGGVLREPPGFGPGGGNGVLLEPPGFGPGELSGPTYTSPVQRPGQLQPPTNTSPSRGPTLSGPTYTDPLKRPKRQLGMTYTKPVGGW